MDKSNLKPGHLRRIRSLALLGTDQLESFLNYVEIVPYAQSGTVFREGQPGDSMFLILEGQCRVYSRQRTGEMLFLRLLEAGAAFGEIGLLNREVRSASVEATQDSILLKISASSLEKLVSEQPALAAQFLLHLARSLGLQLSHLTKKLVVGKEMHDTTFLIK
jgi:CRP-like cAMP-binding protein